MEHGIYQPEEVKAGAPYGGALLLQDPEDQDSYIAQFDSLNLKESHGWHTFPKSDFKLVRTIGVPK